MGWETLRQGQEGLGGPPGGLGGVGRLSQKVRRCREAIPEGHEGWEALLEDREE